MPERRPVGDTMLFRCVFERILGVEVCLRDLREPLWNGGVDI